MKTLDASLQVIELNLSDSGQVHSKGSSTGSRNENTENVLLGLIQIDHLIVSSQLQGDQKIPVHLNCEKNK